MGNILFACFLWLIGIVDQDVVEDRIQARGKCREIVIEHNAVKIRFTSPEDAEEFAEDLKKFINK